MTLTVVLLLALAAFLISIASTTTPPRAPLWVAVLLLSIAMLIQAIPLK